VAVPLRWDELGKLTSGAQFDIRSLPSRLKRLRKDPWAGISEVRQSLDKVIAKLGDA
jgi:bifunctional non-homologous end joining protein LigD